MRRLLAPALALCLAVAPATGAWAQGWGLTRDRPHRGHRPGVRHRPARGATAQDPVARRERLIRRYRAILTSRPGEDMAFARLLSLVRERDGSLDRFEQQLAQELARSEHDYPLLMLAARLAEEQGEGERAEQSYAAAAAARPEAVAPSLALARLARAAGDLPRATSLLEGSLARVRADARHELWRQLGEVALESGDVSAARPWYRRLMARSGAGLFSRSEFARALAAHGLHTQAAAEYERLARALRGDPRVLAPILRGQARQQLEAGDPDAAIATVGGLLRRHHVQGGERAELLALLEQAHRRLGRLPEFADELAGMAGRHADMWALVGRLRDEAGDTGGAAVAYRRALRLSATDLDTRERLVQVLVRAGELEAAIQQSRLLVRAGRGESRYLFALVRLLVQTGQREAALEATARASRSSARDVPLHRALAELYDELGEDARATAELARVLRLSPRDPEALVALGTRRLGQGDRAGAIRFFRRVARAGSGFHGHLELGQVLADHDLLPEAERELRAALRLAPNELSVVRALASVLERTRDGGSRSARRARETESAALWARVLELAQDAATRREAREHMVLGSIRRGVSREDMSRWRRAFAADPPDLEAGRFLALALLRQRPPRREQAAALFERLLEQAPGDLSSLHSLERVRTLMGDRAGAIRVLERLVRADPRRAASYLGRMAEHAHALYRDDDALRWAREAAHRAPDDASASRRLGQLLRTRQDLDGAVRAFEQALSVNARLFDVRLTLAEIHLARGETQSADEQYRSVLVGSPDDELVLEAARASMRIHLAAGSLSELEATLLPLAVASASRPIFRRLLVEIYDRHASPLIEAVDTAGPESAEAHAELLAMGRRALSPLLEALADDDPAQRSVALRLLAHLGRREAAAPLLSLAERGDSLSLRLAALRAAAGISGEAEVPRLISMLRGPKRRLHVVAAFALARVGDRRALDALRASLRGPEPGVRAYAALGLGASLDRRSLHPLAEVLASDRAPTVVAAAAWALGRLLRLPATRVSAASRAEIQTRLLRRLRSPSSAVALASASALALTRAPGAGPRFAAMLFLPTPGARAAAVRGLTQAPGAAPETRELPGGGAIPSPSRTLALLLRQDGMTGVSDLSASAESLKLAAAEALAGSERQASWTLRLLARPRQALSEVLPAGDARAALVDALLLLVPQLEESLVTTLSRPSPELRRVSLSALSRLDWSRVVGLMVTSLDDSDARVRQAALEILLEHEDLPPDVVSRVIATFGRSPSWAERLRGARALGVWADARATPLLLELLTADDYAFVREAAATSLGRLRGPGVDEALRRAATDDVEPRVRAAASAALHD